MFVRSGKIRDIYSCNENLIIFTSDKISAFDFVFEDTIPNKGKILNCLSAFWFTYLNNFNYLYDDLFNHFITINTKLNNSYGNSMLVKKTKPIPVECIVRNYLTGSSFEEYKIKGSVSGIELPKGLVKNSKLPEPIFTPSIKSKEKDQNITNQELIDLLGEDVYLNLKSKSLTVFEIANDYIETFATNLILADTKIEFGEYNDELIIIDELLTPDNSRYWRKGTKENLDKQIFRDWLNSINFNYKNVIIPEDIKNKIYNNYLELFINITGHKSLDNFIEIYQKEIVSQ